MISDGSTKWMNVYSISHADNFSLQNYTKRPFNTTWFVPQQTIFLSLLIYSWIYFFKKSEVFIPETWELTVHTHCIFFTKLLAKYYKNKDLIFSGLANRSSQMTVTSRLFLLMQSRVKLLVPPLRVPSPSWGDGGGPDMCMAWAEGSDRLEACKDASLCWCLVCSVCSSHPGVCCSLDVCSTGCWLLVGCRSLRSSNSSLFSSSASASSCLLRRSAPNRARMSHITRDNWPCRRGHKITEHPCRFTAETFLWFWTKHLGPKRSSST